MSLKEYEYSFEVKDLQPFINFCKNNDYEFVEEHKQQRTIFRDKDRTYMARITVNEKNGVITKELDFKEDKLIEGQILGERKESLPLKYTDDNVINSILEFLNLTEDNTLIRTRYVYKLGNVKFELDAYTVPRKTFVVGIEGEKIAVDNVYEKVKDLAERV